MKRQLFIDFDNTIVNSTMAFCKTYNANRFELDRKADWTKVRKWDFSDECPDLTNEEIERYFASDYFFMKLRFMPNALTTLKRLVKYYDVKICSIGTPKNITKKVEWIEKNITSVIPEISDGVYIVNKNGEMGKGVVNMEGAVIVDDSSANLRSSNAFAKVNFGIKADWNKDWDGVRVTDWEHLGYLLIGIE